MIRMYPDGIVEGSPEDVAAFKHIDAALTARNARPPRQRALPSGPKRVRSSRPNQNQVIRDWASVSGIKVGPRGRIPQDVVDAYEQAKRSA